MMKPLISTATLALCLSWVCAQAAEDAAPPSNQLGSCARGAAGKQGAELKTFLQTCAAAKVPAAEAKAKDVKARRTACLEQAQGRNGPAHIEFMASCMKPGGGTAAEPVAAAAAAAPAASQ